MKDLTAFQRDILYVIDGKDDPHGLAIKSSLEDHYQTDVNHGRLYPNLDKLVENGLVSKGEYDKRTNMYALTEKGYEHHISRREWEDNRISITSDSSN